MENTESSKGVSGKSFSVASLVLGICGLVIPYVGLICAIVGLILGVKGRKRSRAIGEPTGMATAGIVLSIIGLVGSILIIILLAGFIALESYSFMNVIKNNLQSL